MTVTMPAPRKVEIKTHTEQDRRLRMLLVGAPGTGKTSFARDCHSTGGKTLILAADSNYRPLAGEKHVVDIESWADFVSAVNTLPIDQFDTVAVDTMTQLNELAQNHVCKVLGITHPSEDNFGKSWQALKIELGVVLTKLENRARNILYLAQENTVEVQAVGGRSTKKIVADLGAASKRRINYTVSLTGRIQIDRDGNRTIGFRPGADIEQKDTMGLFPSGVFALDGATFYALVCGSRL